MVSVTTASSDGAGKNARPYPQRSGSLPRHLDAVDAAWLTSLLQNRYPGLVVEQFKVVELINSHTTKYRVALTYNDVGKNLGLPNQVCLKSNWSEGFESGEICELEARFYYLMQDQLDAPLPRSYFADWDGDGSGRGVVMLEDLGCANGKFGNSLDHLGVDGVAHGLESLASLHAAMWDNAALKQPWLHRSMNTAVDTEQLLRNWNYAKLNMAKPSYNAILPAWMYETPELFLHAFDELAELERTHTGPLCLVHGDSHQGNSFLRDNQGDRLGERVWLDWQLVRKGTPWRDITYFMLGALTVEERRSDGQNLVKHYYDHLRSFNVSGLCSFDEGWDLFQLWPVYGMQSWLSNMDIWGQSGLEMVNRFWSAAADYDTIARLTAGKPARRNTRLGEGAREIASGIQAMIDRGEL
ncbi:oxidoreductase family protein [Halioxenophilus aromaticivorans]|uniref:CHK kinase-like domain-containing protein n=1 Tax=Halioxenophilus aromaticivorans TaxID=1306992 RepID=A0AAV3U6Z5_9ALTE